VIVAAKKTLVFVGLGVVVVALLVWQIARLTKPRPFSLEAGKITKLDLATRSGEVEFVHAKTGRTMTVTARRIPPGCEILIDGRRADVGELRVGDIVAVRGLFYPRDQSAQPQSIRVTRSAPATQAAAETP
jgi:hypothetical protein